MKGIEGLLETAKAVVEATERKETELVALLVPSLKLEVMNFERDHLMADSPPRKKGVPSRREIYRSLKVCSLELQGRPK